MGLSGFYGRHNDPTMVECEDCGWKGQVKDCIHTYQGFQVSPVDSDIEPTDECPKCGSRNLVEPGMSMASRRELNRRGI